MAICRPDGHSIAGKISAHASQSPSLRPQSGRWPSTFAQCWVSRGWCPNRRLRQQQSANGFRAGRLQTRSIFLVLSQLYSTAFSAEASALSGGSRSRAIRRTFRRTDAKVKELLPDNTALHSWLDMASARIRFQGLPARICWVGLGDRHRLGIAFNDMVGRGELKAPIVIGRDHLDSGSVASPNRETRP